jgi:hypothetical protein
VGIWQNGAQLELILVRSMDELIEDFEKHRNVPPLPLDQEQWFHWLERADPEPWETHCVRCRTKANEIEGDPDRNLAQLPPVPSGRPAVGAFAPLPPLPLTDSDTAPIADGAEDGPQFSDDEPVYALPDVQVSIASREIILYWASAAKRRIKAINAEIEAHRTEGALLAEDTPSEEEEGSDSGSDPDSPGLSP